MSLLARTLRVRRVLSLACALGLIAVAGACVVPPPGTPPPKVLFYGDSFAREAEAALKAGVVSRGPVALTPLSWPGWALCDFATTIASDVAQQHPALVVLSFQGTSLTPCMVNPATGQLLVITTPAYYDRWFTDIDTTIDRIVSSGAKVVWVRPPSMGVLNPYFDTAGQTLADHVVTRYAGNPNVSVFDGAAAAVEKNGQYAEYLPCLASEQAMSQCVGGQIRIRADPDVHFYCPVNEVVAGWWHSCKDLGSYSSGEFRFGDAIAARAWALVKP